MLDKFAAPAKDRSQIVTEYKTSHIIAEDTGLGSPRSDDVVVVHVFQQGRNQAQKRAMYRALAQQLHDHNGL